MIRLARATDAPAILAIHEHVVANTYAIFRDDPMTLAEVEHWLEVQAQREFPFLVAEDEGAVCAFATFGPFRNNLGYAPTVENAIHVAQSHRGRGLGTLLMKRLIEEARLRDRHAMVAAIDTGNLESIRLHEKLGFVIVGQMPDVAKKFGEWRGLTLMQLRL